MKPSETLLRKARDVFDRPSLDEVCRDLKSRVDQTSLWPGVHALIRYYRVTSDAIDRAIALAEQGEGISP